MIIENKRLANGKKFKGGNITFKKVVDESKKLLNSGYVTTLIDYYGIDENFKGYSESIDKKEIEDKKLSLEIELKNEIQNKKFIPYIQMYEFEALLFSDLDTFIYVDEDKFKLTDLKNEIRFFKTPEYVNNTKETAPSKRIKKIYSNYAKVLDGTLLAKEIGIEKMREKCLLFDKWIRTIEEIVT